MYIRALDKYAGIILTGIGSAIEKVDFDSLKGYSREELDELFPTWKNMWIFSMRCLGEKYCGTIEAYDAKFVGFAICNAFHRSGFAQSDKGTVLFSTPSHYERKMYAIFYSKSEGCALANPVISGEDSEKAVAMIAKIGTSIIISEDYPS